MVNVIPFSTQCRNLSIGEILKGNKCRWTQKYYKGLGTYPMEAREYFTALDRHLKRFHALQGEDKDYIDLAFLKKKADERKEWLQGFYQVPILILRLLKFQ